MLCFVFWNKEKLQAGCKAFCKQNNTEVNVDGYRYNPSFWLPFQVLYSYPIEDR